MITFAPKTLGLAIAIGAASLFAGTSGASASSFLAGASAPGLGADQAGVEIQLVGQRRHARGGGRHYGGRRGYRRHGGYGGRRYRHRRSGYRHYYGGYWYPYAWWLGSAAVGVAIASQQADYGNAHVDWCLNRYRSYNPRTDAFLSYSGYYKQCISPYSY